MACILHIEDEPMNRLLVRKLLTAAGHEVVDAETGLEGLRLARARRPDLVLVDIYIPDLDGYEVTLRLRGIPSLAGVPVVAITAEGDRETSYAVGADGFIAKPIDARSFAQTIERFLGGHRERAEEGSPEKLREASQRIVERLERKVLELSAANARLEEASRLRREFLRNLSHELATPMTPVVGYLKLLLDEEMGPLTPLQRKSLKAVERSGHRLRSLIDTLLDVSQWESGKLSLHSRPYDFAAESKRAVEEIEPRLRERRIRLMTTLAEGPMRAVGDADKLRRAFVHVLDNAAKFTHDEGEVAVEAEAFAREGIAFYRFRVVDDGPGVPKERLHQILEAFYQVDGSPTRRYGGVGLGLAFARWVCEAMGGKVQVNSPPSGAVGGRELKGTEVVLEVRAEPHF